MDREQIAQSCMEQSELTARLGSPMYEALLRFMAGDVRAGGVCFTAIEPHADRTRGLATADAPLALLSMEPNAGKADIHLTIWPGGEHRLIAEASMPGHDVKVF